MPLMPQGTQEARITDVYLRNSKADRPYLVVTFAATGHDGQESHAEWNGFLTEGAWPIAEQGLVAMGWPPAQNGFDLELLVVRKPIVGRTVSVNVKHEEWDPGEGKPKQIRARAQVGGFALKADEVKAFSSKMRASLAAWSGKTSAVPSQAQSAHATQPVASQTDGAPPF